MKPVRKAVRTFLIKDDKVVTIKYIKDDERNDYYDIPGGKIEDGETSVEASIREFKEETGMEIFNPKYVGNLIVEYPNRIFDFDIYVVNNYDGNPIKNLENDSMWIEINKLVNMDKKYPSIRLLNDQYLNENNFKYIFKVDDNHNIIDEII